MTIWWSFVANTLSRLLLFTRVANILLNSAKPGPPQISTLEVIDFSHAATLGQVYKHTSEFGNRVQHHDIPTSNEPRPLIGINSIVFEPKKLSCPGRDKWYLTNATFCRNDLRQIQLWHTEWSTQSWCECHKNIYLVEPSQRTIFSYVLVLIQRNYQESWMFL